MSYDKCKEETTTLRKISFLLTMIFYQFMTLFVILFNIPIARQVAGFTYLIFVPGITLIKLFKIKIKSLTETVLFATGFSIIFLILVGLAINELHSWFAIQKPISLAYVLSVVNSLTLVCTVVAYLRCKNEDSEPVSLNLEKSSVVFFLLGTAILTIIGAITSRISNILLFFVIIVIAVFFTFVTISKKAMPVRLYPLMVFIIAISLIYHSALVSDKLIHFGSDVPGEVFAQRVVEKNAYWSPVNPYPQDRSVGRTYAMLSVTILPTIYSILLNLNSILVFKFFYSFIFALVPLGLYNLWKNFVSEKFAFISVFFFMSFQPFHSELLGLNKQMMGELFLILLLIVILDKEKDKVTKFICSLFFSFGLIVSHYALAEIFLIFIFSVLIILLMMKRSNKNVTPTFVLLFFVIMFAWYIFTSSSSVYDAFIEFGQQVYNELSDFFNPQSRGTEVMRGLGLEPPPSIWNMISRIFAYITEGLIVIGFINIIFRRTKIYLAKEYFFLVLVAMLFLGALIIVPGLASIMNMSRFYHVLLFFLAPLCIIGAEGLVDFLLKRKDALITSILLIVVLVPYFLFQTGFVYEIAQGYSWSVPLSMHNKELLRLYCEFGYIDSYSICGAKWLSENANTSSIQIYSDDFSRRNELRAYGVIYAGRVEVLSNITKITNGTVYLNPSNTIENVLVGTRYLWNTSDLEYQNEMAKVYSNGGSEVYKK
jgi:uncharacterized membrane protein